MASGLEEYTPTKQIKYINLYMDIAKRVAEMSLARRLKVGAIAVKDNRIISMGWNGMPPNFPNECEIDNVTKPEVIHAESNLLCKIAGSDENATGAAIFITHSPCVECSKLILRSGITQVYYGETYRDTSGIDFLTKAGVSVTQL